MQITILKSKIHRAVVTDSNLDYIGSITIGRDLMQQANILQNEQVHVVNLNTGHRFITYAIEGQAGSIELNGGGARLGIKGDLLIIMTYTILNEQEAKVWKPSIVLVKKNKIITEIKN